MKKRFAALFISAILAVSMFAACGEQQSTSETQTAQISEVKETAAPEATEAPAETTVSAETAAHAETEAPEETEVPEETSAPEETAAPEETEAPEKIAQEETPEAEQIDIQEEEPVLLSSLSLPVGGLAPVEDTEEPEELTAEETEEMDRAMRAYSPSSGTLLRNNATSFYYYSQMTKDQKAMYDAMLMVAEDPEDGESIVKVVISIDPYSSAFRSNYNIAYYGLLYDHPELFWLYNATECDMCGAVPYENTAPSGMYDLYFYLSNPYYNYRTQVTAFNNAVDAFLSDIDRTKSDAEIERAIHDKLVNMVTYNTPVSLENSEWSYCNFAHTAYGALVTDSDGVANYAVCDGYSQAYVYLLQQCGINAAVIVGVAGNDVSDTGGHAWSVVQLDGEWYEVDSTWDDAGTLDELVEEIKTLDALSYSYYFEAMNDPLYRAKCEHYLYNITTDTMTSYVPGSNVYYTSKDGRYQYSMVAPCVHYRASMSTRGYEAYSYLMALAPIATGTTYRV